MGGAGIVHHSLSHSCLFIECAWRRVSSGRDGRERESEIERERDSGMISHHSAWGVTSTCECTPCCIPQRRIENILCTGTWDSFS